MHELYGVRTSNYNSFNWKQILFRERITNKFVKKIKIWHLLRGISLWTMWIEQNDRVFNHEQCRESKMKHLIWDDLVMYAKVAWIRMVKFAEINVYLSEALLKGFDET